MGLGVLRCTRALSLPTYKLTLPLSFELAHYGVAMPRGGTQNRVPPSHRGTTTEAPPHEAPPHGHRLPIFEI